MKARTAFTSVLWKIYASVARGTDGDRKIT